MPSTPDSSGASPAKLATGPSTLNIWPPGFSLPRLQNLPAISGHDIASLCRTLPLTQKLGKVTADHECTHGVHGYIVLGAFPEAQWAVMASQNIAKHPLRLWQALKAEQNAIGNPDICTWTHLGSDVLIISAYMTISSVLLRSSLICDERALLLIKRPCLICCCCCCLLKPLSLWRHAYSSGIKDSSLPLQMLATLTLLLIKTVLKLKGLH